MVLPTNQTQRSSTFHQLRNEFKQLDALLSSYAQLADGAAYRQASGSVDKLKHDAFSAASQGADLGCLQASVVKEVFDLAWAIYEHGGPSRAATRDFNKLRAEEKKLGGKKDPQQKND